MAHDTHTWFVLTPYLERLVDRAALYLEAGLPLHLRGPAGAGKTTLARYLAARRGRPVYTIYGNEAFTGFDLVGQATGYRQQSVVDNYIHNVVKRSTQVETLWTYGRMLRAIREGGTLIYDEFTRSRPEANNVLLSVLEEGVVEVPDSRRNGVQQVRVHEAFRIVLTSNPGEYAGVHSHMDALRDRMITLDLAGRDFETDVAIVAHRTGLSLNDAAGVVVAVEDRLLAGDGGKSRSLRPAIMLARAVQHGEVPVQPGHPVFEQLCDDIAGSAALEKE